MAEGALCQTLYSRPRWWNKPCRTKIHTETCWRENAFTQAFSFTNVHRANFLPKPPGHAKSARPRDRLRPSNSPQWSFELFTSGISPYHCGQLSESRRSFQEDAPTLSAKHLGLFSETPRHFQRNAPAFSAKRSGLFSKTPRPFHQKETPDGAGFLPVPRPVPGCPDYSPVFTSC